MVDVSFLATFKILKNTFKWNRGTSLTFEKKPFLGGKSG